MTDKEIIQALECCGNVVTSTCKGCPYHITHNANCVKALMHDALDLINRQQVEIEELKKVVIDDYASEYDSKIRAEAIKEFKNKVENDIVTLLGKSNCTDFVNCLDYRYKEMVGK